MNKLRNVVLGKDKAAAINKESDAKAYTLDFELDTSKLMNVQM